MWAATPRNPPAVLTVSRIEPKVKHVGGTNVTDVQKKRCLFYVLPFL